MLRIVVFCGLLALASCQSTPVNQSHTIRSMQTLALAYLIPSLPIGYPHSLGADAITCNFLTNTYCPLLKDEVVQYTLVMFMEETFPPGAAVTIEFRIVDNILNVPIVCIRVPIVIVPLLTSRAIAGNNTIVP